jgi:outer membrane protein assembly factor BamB
MRIKFSSVLVLALLLVSVFAIALDSEPLRVNGTVHENAVGSMSLQTAPTQGSSEAMMQGPIDWWNMFHHDPGHTGYSTSSPVTTNNTKWNYTTGLGVFSSPAVNGSIYVGSEDNNVYALNATNGTKIWNYTTGSSVDSSPAVVGGLVYVGSFDDNVYCLNASSGHKVWNYTTGGWVASSPTVVNGVVYVGSFDDYVYALNAVTGKKIWKYPTDGPVYSSPAVANGKVYVGSDDWYVYCLNASSGIYSWSHKTGGSVESSPAVANGKVYVGSDDWNVYCLDSSSGESVWTYPTGGQVDSSPAVVGGLVYVGSFDDLVYCLNASSGHQVWNYTTGDGVDSSPAVVGGLVYVGSTDDNVYCLNASSGKQGGKQVWTYTTGGSVESSPAVANGTLYVGSDDGKIYAFGPPLAITVSPLSANMDVGQSLKFNSSSSGGVPGYTVQWHLTYPNGTVVLVGTGSSWTFRPNSTGVYSVYASVTDAANHTAKSIATTVTVNGALLVSIPPSNVTMDINQSHTFTSTVSGGWPNYSYQWYLNDTKPVSDAKGQTWNFTPSSTGNYTVYVQVTDSATPTADTIASNTANITVKPRLSVSISAIASANPTYAVFYANQSQLFNSSVANTGTPPYKYQWCLDGSPFPGATNKTWDLTLPSPGLHTVYVNVTDNATTPVTAKSNIATAAILTHGHDITIAAVTIGYQECSKTIVDQNQSIRLYVMVANLGNYTEAFSVTAFIKGSTIATQIINSSLMHPSLPSGNYSVITFLWYTGSLVYPIGNYTISANATLTTGETNIWTGPFTYGTVKVTIPGDINGDGIVNILDGALIGEYWGMSVNPPAPANVDINDDGIINIKDGAIVGANWGK